MKHVWVQKNSFIMCPCNPDQIEFGSLGEGKTGEPRERFAREKSKKNINPHFGIDAGIWNQATLVGHRCVHHYTTLIDHFRYIKIHTWLSEAWRNKTKEMYYSLLSLKMVSSVLLPQVSDPGKNFNISEMVY